MSDFFDEMYSNYSDQIPDGAQRDLFERTIEASDEWEEIRPQDRQDVVDGWVEAMAMASGPNAWRGFNEIDELLDYLKVEFDDADWDTFRENYHP